MTVELLNESHLQPSKLPATETVRGFTSIPLILFWLALTLFGLFYNPGIQCEYQTEKCIPYLSFLLLKMFALLAAYWTINSFLNRLRGLPRLLLNRHGFESQTALKRKFYRWEECSEFHFQKFSFWERQGASIKFTHSSNGKSPKLISLGGLLYHRPELLVRYLNLWRQRALAESKPE